MFLVRNGKESFYATARYDTGVRFDPGCMIPCDHRARSLAAHFADADVEKHAWDSDGLILVVNNRLALHARDSINEADQDRVVERVAFDTKGSP